MEPTYHAPQPFKQSLKALAKANRKLASKVKGSCNRHQARRHLARVHRRVAHVRQAFHWELAHDLCAQYDIIRLETLNLQGMKALWGRKVSDLGFASFVDILHHVAPKTGVLVQHVGRWFPSTKLCSACGHVNEHITLRDRVWTCTACGVTHQRDLQRRHQYRSGRGVFLWGTSCQPGFGQRGWLIPESPGIYARGVCQKLTCSQQRSTRSTDSC